MTDRKAASRQITVHIAADNWERIEASTAASGLSTGANINNALSAALTTIPGDNQ